MKKGLIVVDMRPVIEAVHHIVSPPYTIAFDSLKECLWNWFFFSIKKSQMWAHSKHIGIIKREPRRENSNIFITKMVIEPEKWLIHGSLVQLGLDQNRNGFN